MTYAGGGLFGPHNLLAQLEQFEVDAGVGRAEFETLLGQVQHLGVDSLHALARFLD